MDDVLEKVKKLKQTLDISRVVQALETVKRLAGRPKHLIDSFAPLARLEKLADCGRESDHWDKKKFEAIFKQCHPIIKSPNMADRRIAEKSQPCLQDLLRFSILFV